MKKQYFYVKHDELKVIFEDNVELLEFLRNNTAEDEETEVGSIELTEEEFKEISKNDPDEYDL